MLIYNLISYNIVCNTNTTTNANEIKALILVEKKKICIAAGQNALYMFQFYNMPIQYVI